METKKIIDKKWAINAKWVLTIQTARKYAISFFFFIVNFSQPEDFAVFVTKRLSVN